MTNFNGINIEPKLNDIYTGVTNEIEILAIL